MKPIRALYLEANWTKKKLTLHLSLAKKMCFFNLFCAKKAQKSSFLLEFSQNSTTKDYKITYKSDQAYQGMKREYMQND